MKSLAVLCFIIGLTTIVALMAWQGFALVGGIFVSMGWGLLLLPLLWLPHLGVSAASWRMLFAPGRAPRFLHSLQALWAGHGVNTLLPLATIGGEVVKARMLALNSVLGVDAAASVVVDKTVQAVSLLIWGLIGATLLAFLKVEYDMLWVPLGGLALLATGIVGFIIVQCMGVLGGLAKFIGRLSRSAALRHLAVSAGETDDAIRALYRRPWRITAASALRLLARFLLAFEIVLASNLMGHPIGFLEALVLRGLSTALRGAVFVVPNGLGVQEGSFMALGALMGYPPSLMLALSLATRARELLVSLPGIMFWQHAENRALWRRWPALPSRPSQGDSRGQVID